MEAGAEGAGGAGPGAADCALLAPLTEDALVHNLALRFERGHVYTYVGAAVVSVNPGRPPGAALYAADTARRYCARGAHRLPPHVYALAAAAHARARDRREPQLVLVTGESGAGKTEAARLCLQCALLAAPRAALAPRLAAAGTLLEALGHAATARNHNASRFGKLLEMQLDFRGEPVTAHITHYLLEKERAVRPPPGERNFHVLYQLLAGADVPLLKRLKLQRSWEHYRILGGGAGPAAAARHDTEHFAFTTAAMDALGFSGGESAAVLRALAFLLKMGNVSFEPHHNIDGSIGTRLLHRAELDEACALVGVDAEELALALCAPHHAPHLPAAELAPRDPLDDDAGDEEDSEAGAEEAGDAEWARAALDRLLATLYSRLFTWAVRRAEAALRLEPAAAAPPGATLALLDVYGFESLAENGLERLLINYAAERVQAAVAGAVRAEQEEYAREGLPWRPLPVRDVTAAELLDAGPDCVLAALRAAAARGASDAELMARLRRRAHPRLRVEPPASFTVVHFAGAVTYDARGMASKNRDALCRRCGAALGAAQDALLRALFAAERGGPASPRRAGALSCRQRALVGALVRRLGSPRLVRCLRAGAEARARRCDARLLREQVRAQGLLELAALRRAGWCEATCARAFVLRYAPLRRAPLPPGDPMLAARALIRALPLPAAEFAFGHTKVFIRSPRTVWELEALRGARVAALVSAAQRAWRSHRARRRAAAAAVIQRAWRRRAARRGAGSARAAAARRIWRWWCSAARRRYLRGLWARLPARHRSPACAAWPPPPAPALLGRTDALLRRLHHAWRCREYRAALDQTARNRMREKATASALFRGRKASYPASVAHPFVGDYVRLRASAAWRRGAGAGADRYVVFADLCGKVARASGRVARALAALSTAALLLLEPRSLRVRRRVAAQHVRALSLSPHADDVLVVHVAAARAEPPGCLAAGEGAARRRRGDVVLLTCHALELATKLFLVVQNAAGAPPAVTVAPEFEADFGAGAVTVAFHAVEDDGEPTAARLVRRAHRMDVLL